MITWTIHHVINFADMQNQMDNNVVSFQPYQISNPNQDFVLI